MIRILAFVLSICCCIGLLTGTYTAMTELESQVSFTEKVKYGDPSVMDNRVIRFATRCGDHIRWDTEYRFGPEDSHTTEFQFSQQNVFMPQLITVNPLEVYSYGGWYSSGHSLDFQHQGFANLFHTVAAMTEPGKEGQMKLKLKDFIDYQIMNFELNYTSDRYGCHEFMDQISFTTGDIDPSIDAPSVSAFFDIFRFPVLDDQIVTITVELNRNGDIISAGYNDESNLQIEMVSAATDAGLWCVPVYLNIQDVTQSIPAEYAQGMGIYFIPWKEVDTEGKQTRVTLDTEKAQNIYALPETAVVYNLVVDESGTSAWMLSIENGMYVMTKLDLEQNRILTRLELMEHPADDPHSRPQLRWRNGLYLVQTNLHLALVEDDETPTVAFVVEKGALADGFYYFEQETGSMLYEDGILYLADHPHYNEIINIMAFDASGPLYWGEYCSSLYECNNPGASPHLWPGYRVTELE